LQWSSCRTAGNSRDNHSRGGWLERGSSSSSSYAVSYIILWGGLLGFVVMAYMIIATAYGSYQPVRERSESPKQA